MLTLSTDLYVWSGPNVDFDVGQRQAFLPVDHDELGRRPVSGVSERPLVDRSHFLKVVERQHSSAGDHATLFVCYIQIQIQIQMVYLVLQH